MASGIRRIINDNPLLVAGLLVLIIAGCVVAVVMTTGGDRNSKSILLNYTMDDGKTWFSGPARATPFTKDGKEVVEAVVYGCPGSDKKFVGYMLRYPEKYQAAANAAYHSKISGMPPPHEVKRPGDTEWVSEASAGPPGKKSDAPSYGQVVRVLCPGGRPAIAYAAK